jgi:ribokinase
LWGNKLKNIVVLGSINTDLVIHTPQFPKPGETVAGFDFTNMLGGKGANQAVASARLGSPVSMIGRVGSDPYGMAALENLVQNGVDTQQVTVDPSAPSGVAFVVIDELGNNSIIVSPGANGQLQHADLDRSACLFSPQTILVTQLEVPASVVASGIHLAKARGAHIILNPSPAHQADTSILKEVDTLILNETELVTLSRCNEMRSGLKVLLGMGAQQIVLTLGGKGCILLTADREINLPAHSVKVVDSTGAGDAFIGAFSTAIAEGHDFGTACLWGNAAGALATTSLGAQSSLPDKKQISELLKIGIA